MLSLDTTTVSPGFGVDLGLGSIFQVLWLCCGVRCHRAMPSCDVPDHWICGGDNATEFVCRVGACTQHGQCTDTTLVLPMCTPTTGLGSWNEVIPGLDST